MRHQPFWACRCLRSELRRIILAFAIRTASVLGVCFFECGGFVSASAVGIMLNCVGAIELCWKGCTLMGPVDVGLFLGITDNSHLSSSFRWFSEKGAACDRYQKYWRRRKTGFSSLALSRACRISFCSSLVNCVGTRLRSACRSSR
jgi:hypothetical protein